jgi:hypothetical protein
MAKPVKKETEENIPSINPGLIIPEDLQLPAKHENSEIFIRQLKQLQEARTVLDQMQDKTENYLLDFLYERFISGYQKGFMGMLAINYNWPERLLETHLDFLKEYLLDENYLLFKKGYSEIEFKKGEIVKKIEPSCLRKEHSKFKYYIHKTNSTASYWGDLFKENPYWTIETIDFYKGQKDDWAHYLSDNKNIIWNRELLKTFASEWDYDILLENWSLPWSDELLEFITKIYENAFEDSVLSDDYEIENLVEKMNSGFNLLDRISNDRFRQEWDISFLEENKNLLNWDLLSKNPSLPFNFELFDKFEKLWEMGNDEDYFGIWENAAFFEKVFAPLLNDGFVEKIIKRYY